MGMTQTRVMRSGEPELGARHVVLPSGSADETRALGAALGAVARPGDRIALVGPLGAGKTQFAKGFAVGLGVAEVVNSPSFTLMAEYEGRLPLFHQDLYRLAGTSEALEGGLLDERQDDGRDPQRMGRPARRGARRRAGRRCGSSPWARPTARIEVFGAGDAGRRYVAAAETHRAGGVAAR